MTHHGQNGRFRHAAGFAAALFAASLLAACAGTQDREALYQPAPGSFFTVSVKDGDTVSGLAGRYQVQQDDVLAFNRISARDTLYAGTRLRIPAYGHLRAEAQSAPVPVHDHYVTGYSQPRPRPAAFRPEPERKTRAWNSVSVASLPPPGDDDAGKDFDRNEVSARDSGPGQAYASDWDDFPLPPLASDVPEPQPRPGAFREEARGDEAPPVPQDSGWWDWFAPSRDGKEGGNEKSAAGEKKFVWPLKGPLLSAFGTGDNGARNDGINISAARGTPVHAAAAGTVTYVGDELKGYGNLILIRHDNGYVTAYAHADSVTVERGQRVTGGDVIAYAGETGDVNRPQLHFEIRLGTKPVDPQSYLPNPIWLASN